MAVLPQTGNFVINGSFAAVTFFSIILTIYLMRYCFRLEPYEAHTGRVSSAAQPEAHTGRVSSAARPEAHTGRVSSAAQPEAHTGLAPSAASAGTSVPVPMCGAERRSNAVLMSGVPRDGETHMGAQLLLRIQNERSSYRTEQGLSQARQCGLRRTWGQARLCRLRDTGCQTPRASSPSARSRVVAALGQLCLVIMLAAAGVMCGTRGSALAQEGTAWSDSVTLPYDAGTYYLTTDVTIGGGGIWIVPSGGVTLDLNGHNVTGCQFRINSGVTLTVKNSGNSGEIKFETWPIEVNGGSFYFEGGTLTTSGDNSIIVQVNKGSFYMSGGTITGGVTGVNLLDQSRFTMTGGNIINNVYGVYITGDSTAAISGGEISRHRSYGIWAVSGEVTMLGGVIKGNEFGIGIGDPNNRGTLNLSGGTITENTQYGIRYSNGKLNLSDTPVAGASSPTVTGNGTNNVRFLNSSNDLSINVTGSLSPSAMLGISMAKPGVFTNGLNNRGTSANFSSDDSSYDVCLTAAGEAKLGRAVASITSGNVTNRYTSLQDAMDAAQPNDTILLLDNISASTDTFPILVWKELITLDLNGKTISGSSDSSSGDLIQIYRMKVGGDYSYGQLTLNDGSAEKSGEIVCDPGGCENVINIVDGPNVLTMYGGKISGGTTNVKNTGKFVMNGGEISGRTTNVNSSGQFVMSGGKISGGTTGVICGTSCSMTGGEISGASGNGVTLDGTTGAFYLSGGEIKGNGQYAIEAFEKSFVYISNENPIIVSRGSAESSRGIYLHEGSGISIYDTPAAGSSIGVTLKSGAGVAARGRSKAPTEDDLAVFSSDEGYAKFLNSAEKTIVFGYQISYDFDGGTLTGWNTNIYTPVTDGQGNTTGLTQTVNHGSTASSPGAPSKDGSSFQGWYLSETAYDFNTPVTTNNIILKAKWNLIIRSVTVTPGANMTKTEESGDVSQNVNSGSEIKAVVYTANDGYYFPENYSVGSDKGISVTRNSDTQITVSGTPTADALIRLAPPSLKSENTVAAPGFEVITGADEASPSTVRIICRTEDADIWYTTDGSEPADTNSNMQKYVEPITVSETSTIKAFAEKADMFPSRVEEKKIVIAKAMTQKVIIHHVKNNGSWGIPSDMPVGEEELTIVIKDGEVVSEGKVSMEISDGKKNSGEIEVRFIPEVENLSDITVSGPKELIGAAPMLQKYRLSYKASFKDVINIYVTWNDGRTSEPERIKVYALPEDEIGAYRLHKDGTKEYLLFHTYDICMRWLGSDELCRGYERCFHKESPYENPFVTATGVIGEIVN